MDKKLVNALLVLGGTFLLALSVEVFIIPFQILSGGVAGLAVAFRPFFSFNETVFANVLQLILLGVGSFVLGKEFARNTLLSTLAYLGFTAWLSRYTYELEITQTLASFYAGLLGGFGIGLVMRTGASTGGMDIPPLILHKLTGVKISTLVMITDAITILLGVIAYGFSAALIGLVSVFSSSVAIDEALSLGSGQAAKAVQIISPEWEKINNAIQTELSRGVTVMDVQGGYRYEEKKMLLCVVMGKQYLDLLEIINRYDPQAFVITTDASDMHGYGFTWTSPNI